MKKFSLLFFVIVVTFLSFFTYFPLLHPGFFNVHDNTQVVRVFEMGNSLSSGIFPVRWVDGLGYGYGYPIFNFYSPLPYYIGGIFNVLGFNALISTKIMFFFGIVISGIVMYLSARKFFGDITGIICAVLYAYFPYHAVNIYIRGAVGEFYAYAFLPLLFFGIYELLDAKQKKIFSHTNIFSILKISLGLFLVAVSHNLTLFMFLILLAPLLFVSIFLARVKKIFFISISIALVLGILLASFYVLPAFFEMKYTNVSSQVGGGADFRDHFVCLSQYWNSIWGYGGSTRGCLDGLSFKLGKTNILLLLAFVVIFALTLNKHKWRSLEKLALLSGVLFLVSAFLTIKFSQIIWESIPYMSYLQYPWRFINFMGFFMVTMSGYLFYRISEFISKRNFLLASIFMIIITIVLSYKLFVPQEYVNFPHTYYIQSDYIRYTVSKISDEYMPKSFSKPKNINELPRSAANLINTVGNINIDEANPNYLKISFDIAKDGVLHINRAFFPAWRGYENGRNIPLVPTKNGLNASISKGKGIFELRFEQTIIEKIGNAISIISFLLILLVIISPYLRINNSKKT